MDLGYGCYLFEMIKDGNVVKKHNYVKLEPGMKFSLGIGNFKGKRQKVGNQYDDYPIYITEVKYIKGKYSYPKRWWQFWIPKKRLIYICEYRGE